MTPPRADAWAADPGRDRPRTEPDPLLQRLRAAEAAELGACVKELAALADGLQRQHRSEEAENLLRRALAIVPAEAQLVRRLTRLLYRRGAAEEAVAVVDRALEGPARKPGLLLLRAQALADARRFDECRAVCASLQHASRVGDKARALLSELPVRELLARAEALRRDGRAWEAARAYERVLEHDPKNRTALRGLGRVQFSERDFGGALRTYRRIAREPWATLPDLRTLFRSLRVVRPGLVERWLRRLRHRHRAGQLGAADYARLLAAADHDKDAVACLAAVPVPEWPREAIQICFGRHLGRCDFLAARELLRRHPEFGRVRSAEVLERVERGAALARSWGLAAGDDIRPAALERLFRLSEGLRRSYEPRPRSVLLCLERGGIGGLGRQADLLANHLTTSRRDVEVGVLVLNEPDGAELERSGGYEVRYASEFAELQGGPHARIGGLDELQAIASLLELPSLVPAMKAIAELRPQAVHNFHQTSIGTMLAAVLMGVPYLLARLAGGHPAATVLNPGLPFLDLLNRVYRLVAERDGVVLAAVSRGVLKNWVHHTGLPEARFRVIYDGFDERALGQPCGDRVALRAALGIPRNAPVLGTIFRISPEKDPLLWVEVAGCVARRVPEAHFLLVGDGPMTGAVRERIERLGLGDRFHLPGFVMSDLRAYYDGMDVFLLTSRSEGLPGVVIEAQSVGLPVVATDVGGVREALAAEDTGRLVGRRDPDALAAAVIDCFADGAGRAAVAAMAPARIRERFGMEATARAFEDCWGWRQEAEVAETTGGGAVRAPIRVR